MHPEQKAASQASLRPKHKKGAFWLGSTIDPEASFRYHHGHHDLGYKVSLAATTHFIREIAALVRFNGARHAKATGMASADFQAKLGAVAYNLKRWRTLIKERNKTQPPTAAADG